jgi:hypothetical protein
MGVDGLYQFYAVGFWKKLILSGLVLDMMSKYLLDKWQCLTRQNKLIDVQYAFLLTLYRLINVFDYDIFTDSVAICWNSIDTITEFAILSRFFCAV